MHSLEAKFFDLITERALVRPEDRGLICLSGGADSMALLHLMSAVSELLELTLEVVHFDHGLRAESGREALWAQKQAEALGLEFHLRETGHLKKMQKGIQAAARAWRLQECKSLMTSRSLDWSATGHQQDDQQETRLMKLLRGCNLNHLRGMDWRWGQFIRPLLDFSHQQLTAYLTDLGKTWLEDPSNRKAVYTRNRIRHELIPLMEELAGEKLAQRLEALEAQSRLLDEMLAAYPAPEQSPPELLPGWIEVAGLLKLPPLVRLEALHRFIQERLPGEVEWKTMNQAIQLMEKSHPSWALHLPHNRLLKRLGDRLLLEPHLKPEYSRKKIRLYGWTISAAPPFQVKGGATESVKSEKGILLEGIPESVELTVRHRLPGDRFHPHWREKPIKIKDFLRDQGVPLWARDRLPVVIAGNQIAAIYPDHVAQPFQCTGKPEHRLWLEISGYQL